MADSERWVQDAVLRAHPENAAFSDGSVALTKVRSCLAIS